MKIATRGGIGLAILAVTAILVVPVSAATRQPGAGGSHTGPWRHHSGLWVVPTEESVPEVPSALSEALALADRISEEHPADFGPAYVDTVSGKVVVGVTGASGEAVVKDFHRGVATGAANSAATRAEHLAVAPDKAIKPGAATTAVSQQIRTVSVSRSRQQLESIKHSAIDLGDDPQFADDGIWMSEIDPASDRVVLTVESLSDTLATRIVEKYGTSAVAVRVDPNRPQMSPQSRLADYSPFWSGARIDTPSLYCTDAFSWDLGDYDGMLTAGHCVENGGSVWTLTSYMGWVKANSRENWADGIGTKYLTGSSVYRGDMAMIQVTSHKNSTGRVYRGSVSSPTNAPVAGMYWRRAQPGDQYCTSGSYSGEICQWTVYKTRVDHKYITGETIRNSVVSKDKTGWCLRHGDSGGPVFKLSRGKLYATGIISGVGGGGSDHWGGRLDPCTMVYTDIYDAYYGFPGVIKTQ